jgi:hypothetical protein
VGGTTERIGDGDASVNWGWPTRRVARPRARAPAGSRSDWRLRHPRSRSETDPLARLVLRRSVECPIVCAWRGLLSLKRPRRPAGTAGPPEDVIRHWTSARHPIDGCTQVTVWTEWTLAPSPPTPLPLYRPGT